MGKNIKISKKSENNETFKLFCNITKKPPAVTVGNNRYRERCKTHCNIVYEICPTLEHNIPLKKG